MAGLFDKLLWNFANLGWLGHKQWIYSNLIYKYNFYEFLYFEQIYLLIFENLSFRLDAIPFEY